MKRTFLNMHETNHLPRFERILLLALVVTFSLTACSGTATPTIMSTKPAPIQQPTKPSPIPVGAKGCTIQSRKATPNPTVQSLLSAVSDQDWAAGPTDAMVTLLEYSDFQCPVCNKIEPALKELRQKYPQDVRFVYRHFPLTSHDKSQLAARASEAAGAQGRFWEMHDLLFEEQSQWTGMSEGEFQTWLEKSAGDLGLDPVRFDKDLQSEILIKQIQSDYDENIRIGMPGTPFLVINGTPYNGPLDKASLIATVDLILLEKRQFSECPPMTLDPQKQYFAVLHTQSGDITLELFAEKAPLAVNSFVFLARQGWFNGVTFHRVLPNFVAQAGDPTGTGFGGPGYAFVNEIDPDLTFDKPGVLAMANAGPGSNGSQFFITYKAVPQLNGDYTIFGQLVDGMDVLSELTPRDPAKSLDLPPGDVIISVEIIEK
jgi:cyclophilin family peptidyl-prolyl cis-trans isomerase/protein-disulfide isomerase